MHDKRLLAWLDEQPLTPRYWAVIGGLGLIAALDFFDFYVVGFLMAVLSPQWNLTYGQSGLILLCAGLGSIVGAALFGVIADRIGRRLPILLGSLLCGACSFGMAMLPEGAWQTFAALRFGVGFGLGATITATISLIVEHTPTRHRTLVGSLVVAFTSGGPLVASLTMSSLIESIGWRGIAALGALPAIVALIVYFYVPESARWLVTRGDRDRARVSAAALAGKRVEETPAEIEAVEAAPSLSLLELLRYPRALALITLTWLGLSTANYGIYLWGPMILSMQLKLGVAESAGAFVYVALAGLAGKILFSLMPQRFGRVPTGIFGGFGLALILAAIALWHDNFLYGVPVFLILLIVGALFFDGLFANQSPYSAEVFPVQLSARGVGVGQAANGIGKILGPLSLAFLAGADNLVKPEATAEAMTPGFLFLAAMGLMVGLAFAFLGIETHRKPLAIGGGDSGRSTANSN